MIQVPKLEYAKVLVGVFENSITRICVGISSSIEEIFTFNFTEEID